MLTPLPLPVPPKLPARRLSVTTSQLTLSSHFATHSIFLPFAPHPSIFHFRPSIPFRFNILSRHSNVTIYSLDLS
jgi:hypothetical protein